MLTLKRTSSENKAFQALVHQLDKYLRVSDGDEADFFAQYNKIDAIKHVVVAYDESTAVGCGAIKEYAEGTMEVKRMFVLPERRGEGIASKVLADLESWSRELGYTKCVLETGKKQKEAVKLYEKNNYSVIPNYGQYASVESSVCFEKEI